jgi:hypothetical protein
MFARFRLPDGEVNINFSQVLAFEPGPTKGTTNIIFANGTNIEVPFSNRAVRSAAQKAFAPKSSTPEDNEEEAAGAE